MRIKKIEVNHNLCIGCGVCQALASKAFQLANGKSHKKEDWQKETEENIINAARSCPVGAISLYDENGKKIE